MNAHTVILSEFSAHVDPNGPSMETAFVGTWTFWALLSAVFAAMTAIFAKVGVAGVDSDVATFIRTVVILFTLGLNSA